MATNSTGRHQHQGQATQQQIQLQQEQSALESALEEQRALEGLDESQEIDHNQAAHLQPNMGNQAVQDLLSRLKNVNNALNELDLTENIDEELDEEMDLEEELQGRAFGGGGSGGSGSDNPWEQEFFYGGDDDDDDTHHKKRRRKRRRVIGSAGPTESPDDDALGIKEEKAKSILKALPDPAQGIRQGDSVYQSVELALQNPMEMTAQSLDPEDLKDRIGVADPIRTPVEIGRFLAEYASSDLSASLGELLGSPYAALVTPQGGFSTAVARLATLTICSQAALGGGKSTDQAVSLSLKREIWTETVNIARRLAQKGQLHAPIICQTALKAKAEDPQTKLPPPNPLGGEALQKILPPKISIAPPYLAMATEKKEEEDDLLREIDQLLEQETGGPDPRRVGEIRIDRQALQPALNSANSLLSALGRSQVEFAAAAIAIKRINPKSSVNSTLKHADTALRQLAQAAVTSGKGLEQLINTPASQTQVLAEKHLMVLESTISAFEATQRWGFSTLAGAMEAIDV